MNIIIYIYISIYQPLLIIINHILTICFYGFSMFFCFRHQSHMVSIGGFQGFWFLKHLVMFSSARAAAPDYPLFPVWVVPCFPITLTKNYSIDFGVVPICVGSIMTPFLTTSHVCLVDLVPSHLHQLSTAAVASQPKAIYKACVLTWVWINTY